MSVKVSIVCPIYNPNAVYFQQLLFSVINQTYTDYEFIISDNGQLDLAVIPDDNRFKYYKCIDIGIFDNLNNGIRKAKGEYIQIVCQDDILASDFIRSQLNGFEIFPNCGMNFSSYHEDFNKLDTKLVGQEFSLAAQCWKSEEAVSRFFLGGCLPGNLSTVMIKSEVVAKIGLFNVDFKYAGDFEYWQRIVFNYNIIYTPSKLVFIRSHKEQASFTLNHYLLVRDLQRIYSTFIDVFPVFGSSKNLWYINEKIALQHFRRFLKNSFRMNINLNIILVLNKFPFSLIKLIRILLRKNLAYGS